MIKNYFKTAWRNLKKNKLYALINIAGLTIGIVSCLLISIYIKDELSYDRFNLNADKIVRVTMDYGHGADFRKSAVTGTKVGPQLKRVFPQVVDFVRLEKSSDIVGYNNRIFKETGVLYADSSFLKMFSFDLIKGDRATSLSEPNQIIVTQSIAKKYFDNDDPIGKILKFTGKNYTVSAVAEDVPGNSQVRFDFIVPFNNLSASKQEEWWSANYFTYLLLKDKNNIGPLQKKIRTYMIKVGKDELKMPAGQYLTYHLEPLARVHLHSNLIDGMEPNGSFTYIYILVVIAALILLIACVNYINLSIAQSAGRNAEIGVRKVMGAAKYQLFRQFIGESLFVTFIAVVIALGLAFVLLPFFNQVSGKQLQFTILLDPVMLVCLALLWLAIGFLAGAYPALIVSNVNLAKILKSGFSFTSGQGVRRSLIIFQFVISIFLIITTVVILQQLSYIRNKDIGYNKSNVIVLPISYSIQSRAEGLKKAISNIPGVQNVAGANNEPIDVRLGGWYYHRRWQIVKS